MPGSDAGEHLPDEVVVRQDAEATKAFVDTGFRDGIIHSAGTAITKILSLISRVSAGETQAVKNHTVLEKLVAFLERILGLSSSP